MKRFLTPLVLSLALLVTSLAFFSSVNFGQRARLPTQVPAGKTYVYLDENGKEVSRRRAGQSARAAGVVNCAQIPCPPDFDKGIVCWKCKRSPSAATRQ
jgi:hypothetical protein